MKETPCRCPFSLLLFGPAVVGTVVKAQSLYFQGIMIDGRISEMRAGSVFVILALCLLGAVAITSFPIVSVALAQSAASFPQSSPSSPQEEASLLAAYKETPPLSTQEVFSPELEGVVGDEAGSVETAFVLDRLEAFRANPIDLNSATAAEISEIPWISPVLARQIVSFRENIGRFHSLMDLSVIQGVDFDLLRKIAPYVSVAAKGVSFWIPLEGRVRVVGPTSARQFKDTHFYTRATSRPSQKIELSYVSDKDEGESSIGDFQAGYVTLRTGALLSSATVGDFSAQFGQGLVLWAPQGFYRGYEAVSQTDRGGAGVRGYRSTIENGALRGAHAKLKARGFSFEALFSRSKLDATLNDDGTVRGLSETGYHREDWELRGKDILTETMFAFHAGVEQSRKLSLEGTFYTAEYKPPFSSIEETCSFSFTGKRASVGGLSGNLSLGQLDVFGEGALMDGGRKAFILGWAANMRGIGIASVFRSYDANFYNMRASSFSGGNPWNERGVYVGFQGRSGRYKWSGYVDGTQRPRPTSRTSCPSSGYETAGSIEENVGTGIVFKVHGKLSKNETSVSDPEDPYARISSTSTRETINTDFSWTPGERVSMKLRFSNVRAGKGEKGSLVFAGFRYAPEGLLSLRGRVIYFDASSYESRVYESEDDLPGRVTLIPLWDEGVRWYLVLGVRSKKLGAEAKFSQTHLTKSGVDRDEGNPELGLQVDFAF